MRIGFIGLGAMGAPMAANLLAAGEAATGFDANTKMNPPLRSEHRVPVKTRVVDDRFVQERVVVEIDAGLERPRAVAR